MVKEIELTQALRQNHVESLFQARATGQNCLKSIEEKMAKSRRRKDFMNCFHIYSII